METRIGIQESRAAVKLAPLKARGTMMRMSGCNCGDQDSSPKTKSVLRLLAHFWDRSGTFVHFCSFGRVQAPCRALTPPAHHSGGNDGIGKAPQLYVGLSCRGHVETNDVRDNVSYPKAAESCSLCAPESYSKRSRRASTSPKLCSKVASGRDSANHGRLRHLLTDLILSLRPSSTQLPLCWPNSGRRTNSVTCAIDIVQCSAIFCQHRQPHCPSRPQMAGPHHGSRSNC